MGKHSPRTLRKHGPRQNPTVPYPDRYYLELRVPPRLFKPSTQANSELKMGVCNTCGRHWGMNWFVANLIAIGIPVRGRQSTASKQGLRSPGLEGFPGAFDAVKGSVLSLPLPQHHPGDAPWLVHLWSYLERDAPPMPRSRGLHCVCVRADRKG